MLSYQTLIPELTSYIVEFKHWKTTSARRQTTSNRTTAFAISQQNMLSFQWRNIPYEIAKYCRIYGINNKTYKSPGASKYKVKEKKLSKMNFK